MVVIIMVYATQNGKYVNDNNSQTLSKYDKQLIPTNIGKNNLFLLVSTCNNFTPEQTNYNTATA